MKVGINGWRLTGPRTGVARYLYNVIRYWDREVVAGRVEEINFYTPAPIDRREIPLPENIRERVLGPRAPMLVWENLRFGPAVNDDVLFCPSFSRPLVARGRTVVTLFEATLKLYPQYFPRLHWYAPPIFYLKLYEWSGRHAALVLTATETAKRDIVNAYGVSPEKIRIISLAPPEEFHPISDATRLAETRIRYLGADVPFFLFVGKMTPRRNVPLLMEGFADFKRRSSLPHRLLVIGLNTVQVDVAAHAKRLGLGADFGHREFVSDEDLLLLYNAAQAFVLPYSYEALSLTTMEAQATGLPVITVDQPGLREVTGGKAILLSSPDPSGIRDALLRIATDEALRQRLSNDGREFVRQFTWRRTSEETLAALVEVGAGRRPV